MGFLWTQRFDFKSLPISSYSDSRADGKVCKPQNSPGLAARLHGIWSFGLGTARAGELVQRLRLITATQVLRARPVELCISVGSRLMSGVCSECNCSEDAMAVYVALFPDESDPSKPALPTCPALFWGFGSVLSAGRQLKDWLSTLGARITGCVTTTRHASPIR